MEQAGGGMWRTEVPTHALLPKRVMKGAGRASEGSAGALSDLNYSLRICYVFYSRNKVFTVRSVRSFEWIAEFDIIR
jgi:hypothetical protein